MNNDLHFKSYIYNRVSSNFSIDDFILYFIIFQFGFLEERLGQLETSITTVNEGITKRMATQTETSPTDKTAYLNKLESQVAPNFLDADEILNYTPIYPLVINIFSACFCMGCSATFHLMFVKNLYCQQTLARLDYGGISVLIFGSAYPILTYGLACNEVTVLKYVYESILAVACIGCFIVTLIPKFDTEKYRKVRGIMYIILGLSTGSIFVMFTFVSEYVTPHYGWLYALGGYIYIQGAIIYMIRVPERCKPGRFDFCGASHQIFHFAVLGASLLHYWCNYNAFRNRQEMTCPIMGN